MPHRRPLLALLLLAAPPSAQAGPSYQGTYAPDCAKRNAASVTIAGDAVVLRTVTGARTLRVLEVHPGFYGRTEPPPGFLTALLVDVPPNKGLTVEVFESGSATAVELSGHPDVEKSMAASMRKGRLRRCED